MYRNERCHQNHIHLLVDHLTYVHIFLQIPVEQRKQFSRRRGTCWMTVCPWLKEKSVNPCCSTRIWWPKAYVWVWMKEHSPTWKLACGVPCLPGAKPTYNWCAVPWMGSKAHKKPMFVVASGLCDGDGLVVSPGAACLYITMTWRLWLEASSCIFHWSYLHNVWTQRLSEGKIISQEERWEILRGLLTLSQAVYISSRL